MEERLPQGAPKTSQAVPSCTANAHIKFSTEGWHHTAAKLHCLGHGFTVDPGMDSSTGLDECHNIR